MKKLIFALVAALFCSLAAAADPVKSDTGTTVTTESGPLTYGD